jgi:dihydroorotase-like cyclic amidohydrolase
VHEQIAFARDAKFQGTLHIVHISVPESVDVVLQNKEAMNITCGVTPNHCVFSVDELKRDDGLLYKILPFVP